MSFLIVASYAVLVGMIIFLFVALSTGRSDGSVEVRDTTLGPEELERHAVEIARNHPVARNARSLHWFVRRMNDNFSFISGVYRLLNQDVKEIFPTAPAAEWLLDNFYIIEEQVKVIRRNLARGHYSRLPVLKKGYLKGYPRVYAIALELIAHTDGCIDEKTLQSFISAYQSQSMLSMGELWAVSLMLRIALVENIRNICESINTSRNEWHRAEKLAARITGDELDEQQIVSVVESQLISDGGLTSSFVEHLLQMLRKNGKGVYIVIHLLDGKLIESNSSTGALTAHEHQMQASMQVSIGNTITGLRLISDIDWSEIFESLCHVEQILRQDPGGIYGSMDFVSRDYYRHKVEQLVRICNTSEINTAVKAVECAQNALKSGSGTIKSGHVGYYLIGKGRKELSDKLGIKDRKRRWLILPFIKHPMLLYQGLIIVITAFITSCFAYYAGVMADFNYLLFTILSAVLVLIPASELSIIIVNTVLSHVKKPTMLPKLELKDGIPDELPTMVIIPALIQNSKRVEALIEQLEVFYLSNREKNLYFALVGDFIDSDTEYEQHDGSITVHAMDGVDRLNAKYANEGKTIFYFFQRKRTYNKVEKRWMGWERKRGAIVEFNKLLRGFSDTGFTVSGGNPAIIPHIKYVITLDADTILPMGAAKKLVGTIAHPLNSAVVDESKGIVAEGYGLLQPRISVSIPSAGRSSFTRIFAGQGGIDLYTTAVSDVYQDIFGEGIFTGKGIYDVDIFRKVLEERIPDNTVLSHDMLEGCHLRAGLVTDIEFVDGFPSKYNSYSMRLHRWVRGDWQLIPYLGNSVRDRSGRKMANPLSALSRWKVIDNLRRSLLNPSLFLLLILGLCILPGSFLVWASLALITAASPILTCVLNALISESPGFTANKTNSRAITGIRAALYQSILLVAFIPYQAFLMTDAVSRTLIRVFVTRRRLLEWVTAADVEAATRNDAVGFYLRMWFCIPSAFAMFLIPSFLKLQAIIFALPLSILWLLAPFAAYYISRPYAKKRDILSEVELKRLRRLARKTWRYFEDFALLEDNYLPPDNYQEDPPRGTAHRTSPTNIGLMLASVLSACDLGYIGRSGLGERLDKIISTIERMEKWKGHLYNWYNTITLETLRPLYVSTVDSGNLVGYLMVVREGLKEYLQKPIPGFEAALGLKDTMQLMNEEFEGADGKIRSASLEKVLSSGHIDLFGWKGILEELEQLLQSSTAIERSDDSYWSKRFKAMVSEYRQEFDGIFRLFLENENSCTMEEVCPGCVNEINQGVSPLGLALIYKKSIKLLKEKRETKVYCDRILASLEEELESVTRLIERNEDLIQRIGILVDATEFIPLFDHKRQLFSIGYNVEDEHLSKSYYDLLASEARQASYIAIARGEVDKKHWFRLGRRLTAVDGYKGLISWTGTMFEYMMPLLIMRSYENTIFDETYSFVVKTQKRYARLRKIPWGISESGYNAFDINLNYQYKAFGVPELGFKRGLGNDMVVAPYATVLALQYDPSGVCKNLEELESNGMDGAYGFYEAIDYTPSRLDMDTRFSIVKSYMSHHQGMSILALNNFFNQNVMQDRFHADPVIKSAELLLEERSPQRVMLSKEYRDESVFTTRRLEQVNGDAVRIFGVPASILPSVHLLSNGSYSTMITDGGSGYSKNGDVAITRWSREDMTCNSGIYVYIQNINSNEYWSASYEPVKCAADKYRAVFSPDKAEFYRRNGSIETYTEITVSPEDSSEVRRISLTNHSEHSRVMEITSYFEAVLAPSREDASHPAFSKLFVRTEFVREHGCLLASRRKRASGDKPLWLVHTMAVDGETVGEMQFETDRMKFIGRNRDLSQPAAMEPDQPLSDSEGSVLDPVMSLRRRVVLGPGETVRVSFAISCAQTRKDALELAQKYSDIKTSERVFELSWTRSRVESRYLGLDASETEVFLELVPFILFNNPLRRELAEIISVNIKSQPDLWQFGISGDIPIVLVAINGSEDMDIVRWAIKGHEYWRMKGMEVDLVLMIGKGEGYMQPLLDLIRDAISASHAREMIDRKGGVFVRNTEVLGEENVNLFYTAAQLSVTDGIESLMQKVKQTKNIMGNFSTENSIPVGNSSSAGNSPSAGNSSSAGNSPSAGNSSLVGNPSSMVSANLSFYNGLGGFSDDGREYVIHLGNGRHTPAPWSNVISNRHFGFLVTESGGGYTWAENSRENKLTPWYNDPVVDPQGEIIYLSETKDKSVWSLTPMPIYENGTYTVRHGFGYTVFEQESHGLFSTLTVFAASDDPIKICIVSIKNMTEHERKLSLTYYTRPVLGVDTTVTSDFIVTNTDDSGRMLHIRNSFSSEFKGKVAFMDVSESKRTMTGDRRGFVGVGGSLAKPSALLKDGLSGVMGAGLDPCAAMQVKVNIKEGAETRVVFLFGQASSASEAEKIASKYRTSNSATGELQKVKAFWRDKLDRIKVTTPDESMNLMLNGWLTYQTISCRLWARSAYYQSGGAFGFRDQLQDSLAVVNSWPELTREQILLHASRQFIQGDVQHWWHSQTGKGIRTRYSDDLLWLPFVTADYIGHTGDSGILDIQVPFLEGEMLRENEDERYDAPVVSKEAATLYEHCIRSIDRSLRFGSHGIPLMGSGDWNDGMNMVGNKGSGESVWLGWFLYLTLKNFIPICRLFKDMDRAESYESTASKLAESIEKEAWDGSWYRRAYFDDGTPLGSAQNSECRIDSIAQSWSVISGAAKAERMKEAMSAVENYLIDRDEGIIKLLTPPFDEGPLEPGYIKGYVPGVRENGGQYTHAAAWVVLAFAKLGSGIKAYEFFQMINPINHTRTPIEYLRYKVEPYVVAADVYAVTPNKGRGGWTWYTGASGWLYKVAVESMLGMVKSGDMLRIDPCIPDRWDGFRISYKFGASIYNISVKNPERVESGVVSVSMDGKPGDLAIKLVDDGHEHTVDVIMGKT